jgi:hypothetical protein
VQQIAILLGCAVLPHLKALVDIVKHGLTDENQKVRWLHEHCPSASRLPACLTIAGRSACLFVTDQIVAT